MLSLIAFLDYVLLLLSIHQVYRIQLPDLPKVFEFRYILLGANCSPLVISTIRIPQHLLVLLNVIVDAMIKLPQI